MATGGAVGVGNSGKAPKKARHGQARGGGMATLVIDISAVIIALSLCLYSSVISFQGLTLLIEGVATKRVPSRFSFLGLFQNIGIAAVIGGYTFQVPDLAFAGVLLVASALWASSGRIPRHGPGHRGPVAGVGAFEPGVPRRHLHHRLSRRTGPSSVYLTFTGSDRVIPQAVIRVNILTEPMFWGQADRRLTVPPVPKGEPAGRYPPACPRKP